MESDFQSSARSPRTSVRWTAVAAALLVLAGCGDDDADAPPARTAADTPQLGCTGTIPDGRELRVRGRFAAGDKLTWTIAKTREQDGRRETRRITIPVEVLSFDARGGRFRATVPAGDVASIVRARDTKSADAPLAVEYATDRDGAFAEITNSAEVRRGARAIVEGIASSLPARTRENLIATVDSDAFVQNTISQDLVFAHVGYGQRLTPGKPLSTPDVVGNPFGGAPIAARSTFAVRRDATTGCAAITSGTVPDATALRKALQEFFTASGAPEDTVPKLDSRSSITSLYDVGKGRIARVQADRTIVAGPERRVDRTVVEIP